MKKLLKVLLPPFTGFFIYFLIVRYSSLYFTLRFDEMGSGTLKSFMAFYRYTVPLLFAVAVLTQLLIVKPVWDKVIDKPAAARLIAITDMAFFCAFFALAISYAIWDVNDGQAHFVKTFLFMTGVQLIYWLINLLILALLGVRKQVKSEAEN
jgi:hypothetical protein